MTGFVKTVRDDRGFGFITCDDDGGDLFFHINETQPAIAFNETLVGKEVRFEIVTSDKGRRAVNVRPAR